LFLLVGEMGVILLKTGCIGLAEIAVLLLWMLLLILLLLVVCTAATVVYAAAAGGCSPHEHGPASFHPFRHLRAPKGVMIAKKRGAWASQPLLALSFAVGSGSCAVTIGVALFLGCFEVGFLILVGYPQCECHSG